MTCNAQTLSENLWDFLYETLGPMQGHAAFERVYRLILNEMLVGLDKNDCSEKIDYRKLDDLLFHMYNKI